MFGGPSRFDRPGYTKVGTQRCVREMCRICSWGVGLDREIGKEACSSLHEEIHSGSEVRPFVVTQGVYRKDGIQVDLMSIDSGFVGHAE